MMHRVSGVATLAAVSWALSLSGTTCSAAHAPKWIRLPMHPLQLQRQEWRNDSSEKIRNRRRDSRGDEPNHSSIASRIVDDDLADQATALYGWPSAAYHINVDIGTPPQSVRLVVDTGSSNLAVAGPQVGSSFPNLRTYDHSLSSTANATGLDFDVQYVVGSIHCTVFNDVVSIRNGSSPSSAPLRVRAGLGVINSQTDFFTGGLSGPGTYDGIVGLAYRNLAADGLVPLFQALVQQEGIANVFSMEMCLPSDWWILQGFPTGYLTLGWVPPEVTHPRLYTPLLHEEYYGVEVSGMAVNGVRLDLTCGDYNAPALSIVDSGTTDILLPNKVFSAVVAAISAQPGLASVPNLQQYFASGDQREMLPSNMYSLFPDISVFFPVNSTHEFEVRLARRNYLRNATNNRGVVIGHWVGLSSICVFESGSTMGMTLLTAVLVEYDREEQRIGFGNVSEASCAGQQPAVFGPFPAVRPNGIVPGGGGCIDTSVHCGPVITNNTLLYNVIGGACGIVGIALLAYVVVSVVRGNKCKACRREAMFALPPWCVLWGTRRNPDVDDDIDADAADLAHFSSGIYDRDGDDDALVDINADDDDDELFDL